MSTPAGQNLLIRAIPTSFILCNSACGNDLQGGNIEPQFVVVNPSQQDALRGAPAAEVLPEDRICKAEAIMPGEGTC